MSYFRTIYTIYIKRRRIKSTVIIIALVCSYGYELMYSFDKEITKLFVS